MHEVLVNGLGGLSLPKKSVVRLTDRPDMTLDVYRGRKTTMQQQQQPFSGRRPDIDWNTVSKGCKAQNNQPTNPIYKYIICIITYYKTASS